MSDEPSCSNDLDPQLPRCAWLLACSVSRKDASPQSSASARRIPGRILSGNGVHRFRNHCSNSPEYAAIAYNGLNDVFLIAAKYAMAIGTAHAFSDANKRTGLAVCLEYLSLNDFEIERDNEKLADAMVDLVLGELPEEWFADILYALWLEEQKTA
ncbi:type II toxin-antitoxin system death-on-curing family toxin [Aeromonas caviae]|uniref:type II toxin-antitoxin system death-on-curing family toxin n=1 Tax=Aeromonas caviae TaxID=648 RepID=UPI003100CFC7